MKRKNIIFKILLEIRGRVHLQNSSVSVIDLLKIRGAKCSLICVLNVHEINIII